MINQELNLSVSQLTVVFFLLLVVLTILLYLTTRERSEYIELPKSEEKETPNHVSERYGAYIQAQGRYYN